MTCWGNNSESVKIIETLSPLKEHLDLAPLMESYTAQRLLLDSGNSSLPANLLSLTLEATFSFPVYFDIQPIHLPAANWPTKACFKFKCKIHLLNILQLCLKKLVHTLSVEIIKEHTSPPTMYKILELVMTGCQNRRPDKDWEAKGTPMTSFHGQGELKTKCGISNRLCSAFFAIYSSQNSF